MVSQRAARTQAELEAQLARLDLTRLDPNMPAEQVLGPFEAWVLEMGPYRLFLSPADGRWFFFDPIHEDWVDTGRKAGEVIFALQAGEIAMLPGGLAPTAPATAEAMPPSPQPQEPAAQPTCVACGATLKAGARFCHACGKPVRAGRPGYCAGCGQTLAEGARFCPRCGRPAGTAS
jgi:RNA polymerase subunit RPABC4/transcription elongation factor Spt4